MFNNKIIEALFLPITNEVIDIENKKILFINGVLTPFIKNITSKSKIDFIQPFFPIAQDILDNGYNLNPETMNNYDLVFILAPKQKEETRQLIIKGISSLKNNGHLICSAANDAGGKSLLPLIKKIGDFKSGKISKSKAQTIWFQNNSSIKINNDKEEWTRICNDSFWSKPGIYGWNKIDTGSSLLINNLPDNIHGNVADYGCGYGFISYHLLKRYKDINNLYFSDADIRAVEATTKNIADYKKTHGKWTDLTDNKNVEKNKLDFVIMNPPFHEGKKTDINIGIGFISSAYKELKKGGKLYMVANRYLPYEDAINVLFKKSNIIIEKSGFKIIEAEK